MKTRHFQQLPKAYWAYPQVIQRSLQKTVSDQSLAQVEYVVSALQIDPVHLAKYKQICHYPSDGTVPATYLAVLSQHLQMHMMTREQFPFAILGLLHIRNQVKQYRRIAIQELLQLSCRFGELQVQDKGTQFDFLVTAKVGAEVVFEAQMTYLSKHKKTTPASQSRSATPPPDWSSYSPRAEWQLKENLGRQYAQISGDFNLIHLHALSAQVFGFKKAIAHGMWTKARVLAAFEPLAEAYQADVWFKAPIFLASEVQLLSRALQHGQEFVLCNPQQQKLHLLGELTILS